MENVDHGLLEHWLLNIRNVQRLHLDELKVGSDWLDGDWDVGLVVLETRYGWNGGGEVAAQRRERPCKGREVALGSLWLATFD